jgi:hypothetical protein
VNISLVPLIVVLAEIPSIIGTCPRPFASDIEHFGSQTPGERNVKNHKLFKGLKARVFVI